MADAVAKLAAAVPAAAVLVCAHVPVPDPVVAVPSAAVFVSVPVPAPVVAALVAVVSVSVPVLDPDPLAVFV